MKAVSWDNDVYQEYWLSVWRQPAPEWDLTRKRTLSSLLQRLAVAVGVGVGLDYFEINC